MCIKHVDTFATPIRPIAIFNIPLLRNRNFVVLLRHYLLAILVKTDTRRRRSVTTAYAGTNTFKMLVKLFGGEIQVGIIPNNLSVNGTADAVLQLKIHLWDGIFGEDRGIRDITYILSQCLKKRFGFLAEKTNESRQIQPYYGW
jgi:hypothetical protein